MTTNSTCTVRNNLNSLRRYYVNLTRAFYELLIFNVYNLFHDLLKYNTD